ncbi:MAG TPA: cytochrome c [Myxococcota bacterium]|nr:cytochrome c [Myxococcota bacterium]
MTRRHRTERLAFALTAAALGAALACASKPGAEGPPHEPQVAAALADPTSLARGKAIFSGTCTGYCHSIAPGGKGAPDLFDCDWLHGGSEAEIHHTITTGVPNTRMVAFGGKLQDDDIWRIVAFLESSSRCPR